MILIPQKLFADKQVTTILRDGNACILSKELTDEVKGKEGYVSNHVISILISGEQQIRTYDDNLIKVYPNEVLFMPRGVYYLTDLIPKGGTFKILLFFFDDSIIQEFLSSSKIHEISKQSVPDHLKFGVVPKLNLFADSLVSLYQNNQLQNKAFLRLKILELLFLLNSIAKEQAFADFLFRLTLPKKRNIKTFMQKNFDKPLKIEDYAYLTGRSLSTFRRDFKQYYDITPQKWIKEKRLDKALEILKTKEISVTELAYEVGYENISYFIKEFKNRVGQSPKQYILSEYRNTLRK
ncbi:MAG TPA: AraC family transcriptional regulator [Bacteroidetes bacterium]|nr:AraC family transcriptional regulator [Bacteroidota bacterium]